MRATGQIVEEITVALRGQFLAEVAQDPPIDGSSARPSGEGSNERTRRESHVVRLSFGKQENAVLT